MTSSKPAPPTDAAHDVASDLRHLDRAVALSRQHMERGAGGPFGAVVVLDGRVVGEGWNQVTSTCDPTAHAEVVAIRDACRNLNTHSLAGAVIYSSCEPCPMCLAAILWARCDRLVYANTRQDAAAIGFDDEAFYREVALPPEARQLACHRLESPAALAVFQDWTRKADKVAY